MNKFIEPPKPLARRFAGMVSTTILRADTRMKPTLIPKENLAMTMIRKIGIIESKLQITIDMFEYKINDLLPKWVMNSPLINAPKATPRMQAELIKELSCYNFFI